MDPILSQLENAISSCITSLRLIVIHFMYIHFSLCHKTYLIAVVLNNYGRTSWNGTSTQNTFFVPFNKFFTLLIVKGDISSWVFNRFFNALLYLSNIPYLHPYDCFLILECILCNERRCITNGLSFQHV